jgi:hypothetical protein
MPHARWPLVGAVILLGGFALVAATIGGRNPGAAPATSSQGDGSIGTPTSAPSQASEATSNAIPGAATAAATPVPSGTPATTAKRPPAATRAPRATGAPRLAWAEFLSHVNDDRSTVAGLNQALATAAEAQDLDTVRKAAVDILDFADAERDWLREHPPADCYVAAHASAGTMLDAYAMTAERFIDWTAAGGGLGGLAALGVAVDAADAARLALSAFGKVLEGTTCPA